MKKTNHFVRLIISATFILLTLTANAQQSNFSGNWKIDTIRTDFKTTEGTQAPRYVLSHALKVTQTGAGLIIDRANLTNSGDIKHYLQQMTFDGKTSQTVTPNGNNETDLLSWSADKNGLVIHIEASSPDNQPILSAVETWSMADDGKTLVLDRQVHQANGTPYEIKGYYNKQ